MKKDFNIIRYALEEHLGSINENTKEIHALFDYLQEMELKIDKFSKRLDGMQINIGEPIEKPSVNPLDHVEKNVFLVLYTEEMPLSTHEIAMKARVTEAAISDCISSLIDKGVPLLRSMVGNQMFFKLSPSFKEIQAKENLVNLSLTSFIE